MTEEMPSLTKLPQALFLFFSPFLNLSRVFSSFFFFLFSSCPNILFISSRNRILFIAERMGLSERAKSVAEFNILSGEAKLKQVPQICYGSS